MYKMITIDLDGTLLNDQKKFDESLFYPLIEDLYTQGIHIVIATGNQYVKARSYFKKYAEKLTFVTDNGATIHLGSQLYFSQHINQQDFNQLYQDVPEDINKRFIASSGSLSYVDEANSQVYFSEIAPYFPNLIFTNHLSRLTQPIAKLTLKAPKNFDSDKLSGLLPRQLTAVSSGYGFIDILPSTISKLSGIERLKRLWKIKNSEIIVFGDSNNDLELFKAIPHSFAMANSSPDILNAAKTVIGSNNDQAVLHTLAELIQGKNSVALVS